MSTNQSHRCHGDGMPAQGEAGQTSGHALRRRCWEIDPFLKCPTIGMCLTLAEQRRLLKKAGGLGKNDGAYDIHEKLVASLESENRLSRRVDSMLYRKFGKLAKELFSKDADAFTAVFKAAMENGEGAALVWAAGAHPRLSMEKSREIFGEIHMAMHWAAEERQIVNHRLTRQDQELMHLREQIKAQSHHCRSMQGEIDAHRQKCLRLENELAAVREAKANLQQTLAQGDHRQRIAALALENRKLQEEYASMGMRLENALCQAAAFEEQNRCLHLQLEEQYDLNCCIEEQTQMIIREMAGWSRCDATCPAFDLCRKRVLIVGGITRMESLYRELIESRGGIFEYHDGYVKKGARSLEGCFKRADMVLCPVNCNSHTACSVIKNLGKKHSKPVFMLPNSSLSAVSQVFKREVGTTCCD